MTRVPTCGCPDRASFHYFFKFWTCNLNKRVWTFHTYSMSSLYSNLFITIRPKASKLTFIDRCQLKLALVLLVLFQSRFSLLTSNSVMLAIWMRWIMLMFTCNVPTRKQKWQKVVFTHTDLISSGFYGVFQLGRLILKLWLCYILLIMFVV